MRGLAYGDGPHGTLDVYHRRDRPAGAPILLPGAHHDFDLYESIRSAAVSKAVEQFTARISVSPDANHQDWQPAQDS